MNLSNEAMLLSYPETGVVLDALRPYPLSDSPTQAEHLLRNVKDASQQWAEDFIARHSEHQIPEGIFGDNQFMRASFLYIGLQRNGSAEEAMEASQERVHVPIVPSDYQVLSQSLYFLLLDEGIASEPEIIKRVYANAEESKDFMAEIAEKDQTLGSIDQTTQYFIAEEIAYKCARAELIYPMMMDLLKITSAATDDEA